MTTDKAEIDRAIAAAVKELREHGGNDQNVADLIAQFKRATKAEEERAEVGVVPD